MTESVVVQLGLTMFGLDEDDGRSHETPAQVLTEWVSLTPPIAPIHTRVFVYKKKFKKMYEIYEMEQCEAVERPLRASDKLS